MAAAPSGDLVLTGYGKDIDFGGGARLPSFEGSAFVARLDAAGEHRWSQPLASPSWIPTMRLATGPDDSAIVYGDFEQPLDFGGGAIAVDGSTDGFVVKLDAAGGHVFSRSLGGTGYHHGCGVAALADGSIAVAGSFEGQLDADGILTSQGEGDVFVAKLEASGAVLWRKRFGDAMDQRCSSLAVDSEGNLLLAGLFEGAIDLGGGPLLSEGDSPFGDDIFVAKLDSDAGHLWSLRIGAEGADTGPVLGADAAGNVVVAAGVGGQLDLFGEVVSRTGEGEVVLAKLDARGALLWSRMVGGAGDGATSLAVGPENIFAAGSKFNVFLATVSLDGEAASAEHFLVPDGESNFGIAQSVTAVGADGVVVAGMFDPKLDFGCGTAEAQSGPDIFVAQLREAR